MYVPVARLDDQALTAELSSDLSHPLANASVQSLKRLAVIKQPDRILICVWSTLPLFALFIILASFHAITFEKEASDDLEKDDFLLVLRIHLQEIVVALEFQDQASHLVA